MKKPSNMWLVITAYRNTELQNGNDKVVDNIIGINWLPSKTEAKTATEQLNKKWRKEGAQLAISKEDHINPTQLGPLKKWTGLVAYLHEVKPLAPLEKYSEKTAERLFAGNNTLE